MRLPKRLWTAAEITTAARLWKKLDGDNRVARLAAIATALTRTRSSVEARYYIFGPTFCDPEGPAGSVAQTRRRMKRSERTAPGLAAIEERVPPHIIADRDKRAMLPPRDLTALLMGDPLPGRSALDGRA